MARKWLFKRLRRVSEITGMMTIFLLAIIAGEFFQLAPTSAVPIEPMVVGIVAVAAMYIIMLLVEIVKG